jgi:perosamine synthetase
MRHQLPVYSPLSARAVAHGVAQLFQIGDDPRPALTALLKREYGVKTVLLCGSGTQALTIAIQEAARRVDSEAPVALPAFSCFDVASAAIGAKARISLYDLDPETLSPDLASLERVLRAGAGVVVVAHLYGIPVDWESVAGLARRYGAVLVEDAAQGHGGSWNGRRLGSLGDIAVLSFGRGKGWTGGSGGAVLFESESPQEVLPEPDFSARGAVSVRAAAQWALARPSIYRLPVSLPALGLGETVYRAPNPVKAMTRAAAAMLLATYETSNAETQFRKERGKQLLLLVADSPRARAIRPPDHAVAGLLRLPVRLAGGLGSLGDPRRARSLGASSSYPSALSDLPAVAAHLDRTVNHWPGAGVLVQELVTLPTHSRVERREMVRLVTLLAHLE